MKNKKLIIIGSVSLSAVLIACLCLLSPFKLFKITEDIESVNPVLHDSNVLTQDSDKIIKSDTEVKNINSITFTKEKKNTELINPFEFVVESYPTENNCLSKNNYSNAQIIYYRLLNNTLELSSNFIEEGSSFSSDVDLPPWFENDRYNIQNVSILDPIKPIKTRSWFGCMDSTEPLWVEPMHIKNFYGLEYLDLSETVDATNMFVGCINLENDVFGSLGSINKNIIATAMFNDTSFSNSFLNKISVQLKDSPYKFATFANNVNLINIDVSNWSIDNNFDYRNMLFNCKNLQSITTTTYMDWSETGAKAKGMFTNCESLEFRTNKESFTYKDNKEEIDANPLLYARVCSGANKGLFTAFPWTAMQAEANDGKQQPVMINFYPAFMNPSKVEGYKFAVKKNETYTEISTDDISMSSIYEALKNDKISESSTLYYRKVNLYKPAIKCYTVKDMYWTDVFETDSVPGKAKSYSSYFVSKYQHDAKGNVNGITTAELDKKSCENWDVEDIKSSAIPTINNIVYGDQNSNLGFYYSYGGNAGNILSTYAHNPWGIFKNSNSNAFAFHVNSCKWYNDDITNPGGVVLTHEFGQNDLAYVRIDFKGIDNKNYFPVFDKVPDHVTFYNKGETSTYSSMNPNIDHAYAPYGQILNAVRSVYDNFNNVYGNETYGKLPVREEWARLNLLENENVERFTEATIANPVVCSVPLNDIWKPYYKNGFSNEKGEFLSCVPYGYRAYYWNCYNAVWSDASRDENKYVCITRQFNKPPVYKVNAEVDNEKHGSIDVSLIENVQANTPFTVDNFNKKIIIGSGTDAQVIQYSDGGGYTLDKWMIGESEAPESGTVTGDITFKAQTKEKPVLKSLNIEGVRYFPVVTKFQGVTFYNGSQQEIIPATSTGYEVSDLKNAQYYSGDAPFKAVRSINTINFDTLYPEQAKSGGIKEFDYYSDWAKSNLKYDGDKHLETVEGLVNDSAERETPPKIDGVSLTDIWKAYNPKPQSTGFGGELGYFWSCVASDESLAWYWYSKVDKWTYLRRDLDYDMCVCVSRAFN